MEELYDAVPIPDEGDLDAVLDDHVESGSGEAPSLDLSAHFSASATEGDDEDAEEGRDGATTLRPVRNHRGCKLGRRVPQGFLDTPANLAARLQRIVTDAEALLGRIEGVRRRHAKSDFVAGERCANSGCAIVGLRKFNSRIGCEAKNAQAALQRLRNVCPPALTEGRAGGPERGHVAEDTDRHAVLVKAQQVAECNGLGHLELIMRCLETESDVVGVCVPISGDAPHGFRPEEPCRDSAGATEQQREPLPATQALMRSRLEVDVVSANGLRWIKVRSSPSRTGGVDVEAVHSRQANADLLVTMAEYVRRARQVRFAFGKRTEVAQLFSHAPPTAVAAALTSLGVRVASVSAQDAAAGGQPTQDARPVSTHKPFFPAEALVPSFICLDTTALVCLCSETCYPSELTPTERERNLRRYKVLSDQIRSEETQPAVRDGGVVEKTLREFTTWGTLPEFQRQVELALLQRQEESAVAAEAWWRRSASASLSLPELAWCSAAPAKGSHVDIPVECAYLCEVDEERERVHGDKMDSAPEMRRRPNWIVTDITLHEFRWMVETIAGRSETRRAHRLLRNIMVVDTSFLRKLPEPSAALAAKGQVLSAIQFLPPTAKVQRRNRISFGCADALHAVMLTANRRVVNSARESGIHLWARLHLSRSLTELYMHGERRHAGPTTPPPFDDPRESSGEHCV